MKARIKDRNQSFGFLGGKFNLNKMLEPAIERARSGLNLSDPSKGLTNPYTDSSLPSLTIHLGSVSLSLCELTRLTLHDYWLESIPDWSTYTWLSNVAEVCGHDPPPRPGLSVTATEAGLARKDG